MLQSKLALAALVGLAAISTTFTSCSQQQEEIKASRIRLHVQPFDIRVSDISPSGTKADTSDPFKRLAFKVFDSTGKSVFDITQSYTDTGFGTIDFQLPDGTYTLVAVGHNVSSGVTDPTVVADIQSTTLATLPEPNVVDVFCATKEITVLPAEDFTETLTLPRANSKFSIVMSDAIPDNVKEIEFVLNANGAETTDSLAISPTTGFATSDRQYIRTFNVSSVAGKTGQTIGMNILLTAATQNIDIMATAYDANEDVIISRLLEDIPMKQNRITTATGVFFNAEATATISVNSTWDTAENVTY